MSSWQPIETAPVCQGQLKPRLFLAGKTKKGAWIMCSGYKKANGDWLVRKGQPVTFIPLFWQPLPEPPND